MKNWLKEIGSNIKNMDKFLLVIILLFSAGGLVVVFSSSNIPAVLEYHLDSTYFFFKQLKFTILGLVLMLLIAIKPKIGAMRGFAFLLGLVVIGLTIYSISNKISINGANSWLNVKGVSFQPSEFYKTFVIIAFSAIYGTVKDFKKKYTFFLPMLGVIALCGVVFLEPDLGTALIMGLIAALIFFSLPVKDKMIRILKYGVVVLAILSVVLVYHFQPKLIQMETSSRHLGRLAFTDPCSRPLVKTGYQVCNSYIAINNGGLVGRGIGNSTQKFLYLPEAFTDFVFPIIVEEIGVLGAIGLIVGYVILLFRILVIARNATSLQESILAFGTFSFILIHILVNLLGVLALIPLTGVPLPFVSYGGSFLLNLFILLGFTLNISAHNKTAKRGVKYGN